MGDLRIDDCDDVKEDFERFKLDEGIDTHEEGLRKLVKFYNLKQEEFRDIDLDRGRARSR